MVFLMSWTLSQEVLKNQSQFFYINTILGAYLVFLSQVLPD